MKLQNYLTESENKDTFVLMMTNILKECQPFVNEIMKSDPVNFLYSGRKRGSDWFESTIRNEREPKDINIDIHNDFDDEFNKQFGWKARSNTLFVTGKESAAFEYGNTYMIFPYGRYKFLWSPIVVDLYIYLGRHTNHTGTKNYNGLYQFIYDGAEWQENANKRFDSDIKQIAQERYDKFIHDTVKTYRDTDINKAIYSDNEIMLNCSKYYAVRYNDWFDIFLNFFRDYKKHPEIRKDLSVWYERNGNV